MSDNLLLQKYNRNGPRYTSYPTALELHEGFEYADLLDCIDKSDNTDLSLYVHIPFCHKICYYCGCNKVVTRHQHKADEYLRHLFLEIQQQAQFFFNKKVTQLHFGGGTPTFLTDEQMVELMTALREGFEFEEDAEISIEIDPREIEIQSLALLRTLGFNRISIGVQDFDLRVQQAVNREQDEGHIFELVAKARELAFKSVNVDLIYGLPFQSEASFAVTIEKIVQLSPDRISLFNYAHLPDRFAAQRKIKEQDLPASHTKLAIFEASSATLAGAGYVLIGMDHFAKVTDELALLQQQGKLHRNFQGYTTQANCDLLGLGVSAISQIGEGISQNERYIKSYYSLIQQQKQALVKGYKLSNDDKIRAEVIKQLICHFSLSFDQISAKFKINFKQYFADELMLVKPMIDDGLIQLSEDKLQVTATGRRFIRTICMSFDAYMSKKLRQSQFSRVV